MKIKELPKLDIRQESELTQEEKEMLDRARLSGLGTTEAWTAEGTNRQLAYCTHGLMRFFGKFPPPISSYLIEQYSKENDFVLDPMSGSGTTGVECLLRNRNCEMRDVNPLMQMLAIAKTTIIDKSEIELELTSLLERYKKASFSTENESYSGLRDPKHWFLQDTMDSLFGLRIAIEKTKNDNIRRLFLVCFVGIIRRVSRATSQQGRLFLDVETAEPDALPFFVKKVEAAADAIATLPINAAKIDAVLADLQKPIKSQRKFSLVILHPPYFNSYKYSSVNSLELYWLGINHADIRKSEVREFFKVGKPENHEKFVEDMSNALTNAYSQLAPGGHMGFMMGDTAINGQYIPVMRKTLDMAEMPKHTIKTVALRVPKYTEASWAASQRRNSKNIGIKLYDFVIVIRKDA